MEALQAAVKALTLPAEGDEADWLGKLNKVIRDLNALKRTVIDELPGPVKGTEYQVVESRSATRSYNTAALLSAFAAQGWELTDLRRAAAVRVTWRWTELKRAIAEANVTVTVAAHEVEDVGDVDGPQVGEVWKSTYRVEGI